ncbi:hypothetical protein BS47DRAFT_1396238 [Hydnum rufescens UP504]|uniref:Uncharacterized protein n=1 Tax=Hydnum rufescens UP504 TaxID=1448309 RepID=A0A9P6DT49_9AGAM|nr:hypothetical protein BS47DRAFT_1396238 [Hydnum rufescens UP504]
MVVRFFAIQPLALRMAISRSGDQSDTASEVPINDAGDTTIGDTTHMQPNTQPIISINHSATCKYRAIHPSFVPPGSRESE